MKHYITIICIILSSPSLRADQLLEFENPGEIDFAMLADKNIGILNKPGFEEYFNRGTEALRKGNYNDAIKNLKISIEDNSSSPQTHFNLALAYEYIDDIDHAIEAYKDAILQRLDYPKAHHQLAKLLQKKGLLDQATIHYEQAVKYDASLSDAALSAARLLCEQEQWEDAIPYFECFLSKRPKDVIVRFEYANTLNTINQTEKSLSIYYELLRERPNDVGILYNTAYTLKKLNKIKEAMPYYEAALKRNPNHAEAHFSLGLAHLLTGNFIQGWAEYEWRWKRGSQLTPREFSQPVWDGSPLNGKTILLHAEQGLGDTFQFVRYAQIVKEQHGGRVIFAAQRPLQDFIRTCCPYIDEVVTLSNPPRLFDVHAPLMSLPHILKSDEKSIPHTIPYLFPHEKLVEFWKMRLSHDKHFKVGICWQGNNKYSTPFLRAVVAAKSMALLKFARLAHIPNISFYSLQRETGTDQLSQLPAHFKLITFEQDFDQSRGRFNDTAALIKNLDLVITIDTSICHLAAALGTPTWVMLPEPPDWRWMLERSDTPWYPNMRLFRQPASGNWDTVLDTIAIELEKLVSVKTKLNTVQTPGQHSLSTEPNQGHKKSISFATTSQLKQELSFIREQFKKQSHLLLQKTISPEEKEFLTTIRTLYHLGEIHEQIQKKIEAVEDGHA